MLDEIKSLAIEFFKLSGGSLTPDNLAILTSLINSVYNRGKADGYNEVMDIMKRHLKQEELS